MGASTPLAVNNDEVITFLQKFNIETLIEKDRILNRIKDLPKAFDEPKSYVYIPVKFNGDVYSNYRVLKLDINEDYFAESNDITLSSE